MTDLANVRDRMGSAMRPAEGPQEGLLWGKGPAVRDYFSPASMWSRFSGEPSPREKAQLAMFKLWSHGKSFKEIAQGINQFELPIMKEPIDPMGAMLPARGLKELRALQKIKTQGRISRGMPKRAAGILHKVESRELREAADAIPDRMWERIRSIKRLHGDPEVSGRHVRVGSLVPGVDEADVYLHPESFDASTVLHEIVGHEGSQLAKGLGKSVPNLTGFRKWWDQIHEEMRTLSGWLERSGGRPAIVDEVYRRSPDEVFSRFTESSMLAEDKGAVDAIVGGYRRVYEMRQKTLDALEIGLDEAERLGAITPIEAGDIMKYYSDASRFQK